MYVAYVYVFPLYLRHPLAPHLYGRGCDGLCNMLLCFVSLQLPFFLERQLSRGRQSGLVTPLVGVAIAI